MARRKKTTKKNNNLLIILLLAAAAVILLPKAFYLGSIVNPQGVEIIGAENCVDCDTDSFKSSYDDISMSAWFRCTAPPVSGEENSYFIYDFDGTRMMKAALFGGGETSFGVRNHPDFGFHMCNWGTDELCDGEWHMGVLALDNKADEFEWQCYVDGASQTQSFTTPPLPAFTVNKVYLGQSASGANNFIGDLALVKAYDYRLSTQEVSDLYNQQQSQLPDIETGHGVPIIVGEENCLECDIDPAGWGSIESELFTVNLWYKCDGLPSSDQTMFELRDGSTVYATLRSYGPWAGVATSGTLCDSYSPSIACNNQWHMMTIRMSPNPSQGYDMMYCFKDGSQTGGGGVMRNTYAFDELYIGNNEAGTSAFDGQIAHMQIFGNELTSAEITALYQQGQQMIAGGTFLPGEFRIADLTTSGSHLVSPLQTTQEDISLDVSQIVPGTDAHLTFEVSGSAQGETESSYYVFTFQKEE